MQNRKRQISQSPCRRKRLRTLAGNVAGADDVWSGPAPLTQTLTIADAPQAQSQTANELFENKHS